MHSVKEQIFVLQSVKEHNFYIAQCQAADFSEAQCQGANFDKTECKGAYAGDGYIEFKDRIGKETELKTMKFAGELDEEAIEKIEEAKNIWKRI